jgi:CHAD domain-containing protein
MAIESVHTTAWDVKLNPSGGVAENVTRILRHQYDILIAHESGTRSGEDPENLHRMRVAVRKMRTALKLFGSLPDRKAMKPFREELRWLSGCLGQVRDRDTALETLRTYCDTAPPEDRPVIQVIVDEIEKQRKALREELLLALDSERYISFKNNVEQLLGNGLPVRSDAPAFRDIVPRLIAKSWKRVQSVGPEIPGKEDERIHRLRLNCKRLRYLCEFTRPIIGKRLDFLRNSATRVQETLGIVRDSERDLRFLESLSGGTGPDAVRRLQTFFAHRTDTALSEFTVMWKRMVFPEYQAWVRYHLNCL